MINFTAVTDNRFFGFDKVAHLGVATQLGARTYSGKGSQYSTITDSGFFNHCIGLYLNPITDDAVNNMAVGANADTGTNLNFALKEAVDINAVVGAGFQCTPQIKTGRVCQAATGGHQGFRLL